MNSHKNDVKIDFVGIGAPKCATTWIYECLQEHPQIYLAPKDQSRTSFFMMDDFQERISAYKSFLDKDKIKGVFTVFYWTRKDVPSRIRKHNPNIKLIVSLRNPVERAYSQYLHASSLGKKKEKNFEQAMKKDPEGILEPGFYYKHLIKYFEKFPSKNILILLYDDIKKDPIGTIQRIYKFLSVDPSFVPESAYQKVAVTKFKLTKLGKLIHGEITPLLRKTKWGQRIHQSPWIRKYFYRFAEFYTKGRQIPPMKKETREYLKRLYREDIENLEKLIGRDLSFWK